MNNLNLLLFLKIPNPNVQAIPNPLNPTIKLTGLNPATAKMFKSAVYPCVIEFDVKSGKQQKTENRHHSGVAKTGFGKFLCYVKVKSIGIITFYF
jgi:hypothetical protein